MSESGSAPTIEADKKKKHSRVQGAWDGGKQKRAKKVLKATATAEPAAKPEATAPTQSSLTSFFVATAANNQTKAETSAKRATVVEHAQIPGLFIVNNFIDKETENQLIKYFDSNTWCHDLARRVQHFGFKYNYKSRSIDQSMRCDPLPDCVDPLTARIAALTRSDGAPLLSNAIDQMIVNDYQPGQGIGAHVDCTPCFTDGVCSLSLASDVTMVFHLRNVGRHEVRLLRRSLIVLTNDARFKWTHSIPARSVDPGFGPRARRVSLTFRSVILSEKTARAEKRPAISNEKSKKQ